MIDLISFMKEKDQTLPKSEQRVLNVILSNLDRISLMNQKEISSMAEVSDPTVTRFCHNLGCKSFRDFKIQLTQNLVIYEHITSNKDGIVKKSHQADDHLFDLAENLLVFTADVLLRSLHYLDLPLINKAAQWIARSKSVTTFGMGGTSGIMSDIIYNRLSRLGIRIKSLHDILLFHMNASNVDQGDIAIFLSTSGCIEDIINAAKIYKEYGAKTICITQKDAPLAKECDIAIQLKIQKNHEVLKPGNYRYVFMSIIDILSIYVAYQDKEKSLNYLRRQQTVLAKFRGKFIKDFIGD